MSDAAYRIAAIPGDGVGPEVVAAARAVFDAAGQRFGFAVEWSELLAGGSAIDAHGLPIRDEDVAAAGAADAILLGAVGGPKWDDPNATVRPEQALFALRGGLGLFANLRPVTVHSDSAGVMRRVVARSVHVGVASKPLSRSRSPWGRSAVNHSGGSAR